jgi:CheY-like chemotaxis protein
MGVDPTRSPVVQLCATLVLIRGTGLAPEAGMSTSLASGSRNENERALHVVPAVNTSVSLVPSVLRFLVRADGDAVVLRAGARPYIMTARGPIDLGTRDLPLDVIHQLVKTLLPNAARAALDESGAVAYVLPHLSEFATEHFTVIAAGGDDLRVVIQRGQGETGPRVGAPASHGRPEWADATGPRDGADLTRRTTRFPPVVLLIDDSLDQLDLYEAVLSDVYQVRLASRGEIGVELALADPPDVALVDIEMPGMDGWEVCRRLHAHPRTTSLPLVILTARDPDGLRDKAMRVGAADLLSKPCHVDMLRDHIRAALDRQTMWESN